MLSFGPACMWCKYAHMYTYTVKIQESFKSRQHHTLGLSLRLHKKEKASNQEYIALFLTRNRDQLLHLQRQGKISPFPSRCFC